MMQVHQKLAAVEDRLSALTARVGAALDHWPVRVGLFLWVVIYALAPLIVEPRLGGSTQDWQFFQFFDEVARKTLLEFHQLPLWNPYFCGGQTLVGNPQTTFLVPTFPLVLLFGTTIGMRLSIFVVLVVGCEGGWRLVRQLGMGRAAALVGALAFPLFGRTFGWLTDGQYGLHGTALETWVLYGYLRGLERPPWLAVGAAFFAWLIAFRGIQPGPQMALALGLWSLLEARRRFSDGKGHPWRARLRATAWPLVALAILGFLAGGFVGIRMVPALEVVLTHPRVVKETAYRTLTAAWVEIYAMPDGTPGYGASGYAYIGWLTYAMLLLSAAWGSARRRAWTPLLIALFFLVVQLGYQGEYSLYAILKSLPLYKSLKNPTLYSFTAALFLVLCACFAVDEVVRTMAGSPRRLVRIAGLAVAVVLAVVPGYEVATHGHKMIARPNIFTFPSVPTVHDEFRQSRGNYWMSPTWPSIDRGTLSCYDETPWVTSTELKPDLPHEEYLADPSAGTVVRRSWSPNRIELAVDVKRRSVVLINQNWDPGWHASGGRVVNKSLLLAVEVAPGARSVVLWYWPVTATAGVVWMVIALGLAWGLGRRQKRLDYLVAGPAPVRVAS